MTSPTDALPAGGQPLVLHVATGIAKEAAGPSYSIPRLCGAVAATGVRVELHVTEDRPDNDRAGFEIRWHPADRIFGRAIARSSGMRRALTSRARNAAVIHSHGLWRMPSLYAEWAASGSKCALVASPRGTLSPMALMHSRVAKRIMWAVGQRQALVRVDCLHATSDAELIDIRNAGFRQPIAVIPNGFDLPDPRDPAVALSSPRRVLYLGRVHPIKGLDVLIRAWNAIRPHRLGWELHIVGTGKPVDVEAIRSLIDRSGASGILMRGPAYGVEKSLEYQRASVFVLPSRSENFAMTVAEALGHGTPAIVTKGAPWQGLDERRCGWWIDHGVDPLAAALREAIAMSDEARVEAGERSREWIKQEFSWGPIGIKTRAVYDWLGGVGPRPDCVALA